MQHQQQQQLVNLKAKDFYYKKYYSRNPNEILIYENNRSTKNFGVNSKNSFNGEDIYEDINSDELTDNDDIFFNDNDFDSELKSPNKHPHMEINKNSNKKHIYEKKPPQAPSFLHKMPIFKSAYYQKVLSKNRSNSCENHGILLNEKARIFSEPEQNSELEVSQDSEIKAGIVQSLRRKFLDANSNNRPPCIRKSVCMGSVKKTKISESNEMMPIFSQASIKPEKINDESNQFKLLSPSSFLNKNEVKKVVPTKFHNSRLKSIERSLSTSAHIDDAYKLVKQSLVSIISIFHRKVFETMIVQI